jgi:hypothetical protein
MVLGLSLLSTSSRHLALAQSGSRGTNTPAVSGRAFLDRYCVGCHNQKLKTAGLTLDTLNVDQAGEHAEI